MCKSFKIKFPKIIKIKNLKYRGFQSGAIKKGIDILRSEYVILMDADLQDDPKKIKLFLDKIYQDYDIVIGFRIKRKAALILKVGLKIYDYIFKLVLKKKLPTYRAQYTAYRTSFIKNFKMKKNDHRYLIPIAISRGAKKIGIIKLKLKNRKFGTSHYNQYIKSVLGAF